MRRRLDTYEMICFCVVAVAIVLGAVYVASIASRMRQPSPESSPLPIPRSPKFGGPRDTPTNNYPAPDDSPLWSKP